MSTHPHLIADAVAVFVTVLMDEFHSFGPIEIGGVSHVWDSFNVRCQQSPQIMCSFCRIFVATTIGV